MVYNKNSQFVTSYPSGFPTFGFTLMYLALHSQLAIAVVSFFHYLGGSFYSFNSENKNDYKQQQL